MIGSRDAPAHPYNYVETMLAKPEMHGLRGSIVGTRSPAKDTVNPDRSPSGAFAGLSARQVQIADLVVTGRSNREIADELGLSPRTVETHVSAIFDKLGISTRVQLTAAIVGARNGEAAVTKRTRTNLPRERSRLIGRERELDDIARLLAERRFVTVTGTGGAGKTRVAQAVGEGVLATETDVWFVELAPVSDASSVADAVARTLDVTVASSSAIVEAIVAQLEKRRLLIVLDNCEHVIAPAAALADALLQGCPDVRVLVTSREPLRIAAEYTYRLPSLRVPTLRETDDLDIEEAASFAAIELFAERARAVRHAFTIDEHNVRIVADICRRLDGIPLAIELAAARVDILSIRALADKLDRRLHVLRGGDRLVLPRHQTMHALIDWSYDLLSESERELFDRLSVFAGSFGLREAAVVHGARDGDVSTLEILSSLVDKSLLTADVSQDEAHYAFLETFRQYAAEKLAARGDTQRVARLHAIAYAELAERIDEEYEAAPTEACFERIERAAENWRAALAWSIGERGDVVAGQRLAASQRGVYSRSEERWRWTPVARSLVDDTTPALLAARLERAYAFVTHAANAYDEAIDAYERAIGMFRALRKDEWVARAEWGKADTLTNVGRYAEAEELIARALTVARGKPPALWIANLYQTSARKAFRDGDVERGRATLHDALAMYEACGAARHASRMKIAVAECEFGAGNAGAAREIILDALAVLRAGNNTLIVLQAVCNLANYCIALRRFDEARGWATDALDLANRMRDGFGISMALQHFAALAVVDGRANGEGMRHLADAARILGYIDGSLEREGLARETYEKQQYENVVATLHARLGEERARALMDEGARMTLDRATACAMGEAVKSLTEVR